MKAGRWCATNRTDDSAINDVHVGVDDKDLADAPVFVRVTAEGKCATPASGGGLLYRFDAAARTRVRALTDRPGYVLEARPAGLEQR